MVQILCDLYFSDSSELTAAVCTGSMSGIQDNFEHLSFLSWACFPIYSRSVWNSISPF